MPKSKTVEQTKRDADDSDSDDENTDQDNDDENEDKPKCSFKLMRSAKLAGLAGILYLFLSSDVFVLRVLDRPKMDLVSGTSLTKKGIVASALVLVLGIIGLDLLIAKEKI